MCWFIIIFQIQFVIFGVFIFCYTPILYYLLHYIAVLIFHIFYSALFSTLLRLWFLIFVAFDFLVLFRFVPSWVWWHVFFFCFRGLCSLYPLSFCGIAFGVLAFVAFGILAFRVL